jgi:GMP synthase-like glutamine amidotransferase
METQVKKQLRIHIFMHVPFEGPGCIEAWIARNNHTVTYTQVYETTSFPPIENIDWLIMMGGTMSVYEENEYRWLVHEKEYVRKAVVAQKVVIGICLGSQMIASALGAKVYPNTKKEIGWFDLKLTDEGQNAPLLNGFEKSFPVFHWHGDTFDLPEGAVRLFYSDVTPNQAYVINDRVVGFQFHFEATVKSIGDMVEHGTDELIVSDTVQAAESITINTHFISANNGRMFKILDNLVALSMPITEIR